MTTTYGSTTTTSSAGTTAIGNESINDPNDHPADGSKVCICTGRRNRTPLATPKRPIPMRDLASPCSIGARNTKYDDLTPAPLLLAHVGATPATPNTLKTASTGNHRARTRMAQFPHGPTTQHNASQVCSNSFTESHRNENRIVNGFPGEQIPVVRTSSAFNSGRQACCSNATTIQRNDADFLTGTTEAILYRQRSEATTAGLNVPT